MTMAVPYRNEPVCHLVRDKLLHERFLPLWRRCLLPGRSDNSESVWQALAARYSEPHRYYHDSSHLAHCMEQLDIARGSIAAPDEVEMAIWFHDVINQPGQSDNEARSADYFRMAADDLMAPEFIDSVVDLIMVTTHRDAPLQGDQRFICDIDLASFGCPWECFMEDSAAVKAEFNGTMDDYYRGKKTFLGQMLQRPRIFLTDFFHERYEEQGRKNIRRLLELVELRAD